jgi:hypothetical protein
MVERGELPATLYGSEKLVFAGGDEADVAGRGGDRREQGQRLELEAHTGTAVLRAMSGSARATDEVGDEESVELGLLCQLRRSYPVAQVRSAVGIGRRMPPRRRVVAEAHEEGVECQTASCVMARSAQ